MQTPMLPLQKWTELKKDLVSRWQELTENDLEQTQGKSESMIELFERKLGMSLEKASEKVNELTSHYRLYEEPEEDSETREEEKRGRVLELRPRKPGESI